MDPDGLAPDTRLLGAGVRGAMAEDSVSHNYSVSETNEMFETASIFIGGAGLVRHSIIKGVKYIPKAVGSMGRSLGIKTTLGLGKGGLQNFYAKNLLKDGKISAKDFGSLVPDGVKGMWKPTKDIKLGRKYNFKVNNMKVEFKMHSPDKKARLKYPGSNSGSQWTDQIKVGNKFLGTDGQFHKFNNKIANKLHIPLRMK